MNIAEIITLIIFIVILLVIGVLYFVNTLKINKKAGKGTKKVDNTHSESENTAVVEQKPVAVGIIQKEGLLKPDECDFAPFRDQPKQTEKEKIKKEVSNLTPEMKKIIVSDLLKPKF